MPTHSAFGLSLSDLDIVVVDDSKTMRTLIQSMIYPLQVRRVRAYESAERALDSILSEPPNLIISDWNLANMSGFRFLQLLRAEAMAPLCMVPFVVVTAHATYGLVERCIAAGAHSILAKPFSQNSLKHRLEWILHDDREMIVDDNNNLIIDGVCSMLEERGRKRDLLSEAREHYQQTAEQETPLIDFGDISLLNEVKQEIPPARSKDGNHGFGTVLR